MITLYDIPAIDELSTIYIDCQAVSTNNVNNVRSFRLYKTYKVLFN